MSLTPKVIYYCWFGEEKPKRVIDCINNWKEKLSDYKIVEINEKNKELFDIEEECQKNLWFKTVWENKMWAYVADYARLKVLYERGGIYFDTDVTVEKDITDLVIKNKLILGWENNELINIAVGIVGLYNPLIKEMIDFYNNEIWNSKLYTIPQIVTYIIKKHYILKPSTEITENKELLILPQEYFYPLPYRENRNYVAKYITDKTYTIHWWEASWIKPNVSYFLNNKNKDNIDKLLEKCFQTKIIFENHFLKIYKKFLQISIELDYYYLLRFKYKFVDSNKYLTIIILGFQFILFKVRKRY